MCADQEKGNLNMGGECCGTFTCLWATFLPCLRESGRYRPRCHCETFVPAFKGKGADPDLKDVFLYLEPSGVIERLKKGSLIFILCSTELHQNGAKWRAFLVNKKGK